METAYTLQKLGHIYALRDPESFQIRYIGKTTQSLQYRLMYHIRDSRKYNHYNASWIKGLTKRGLKPIITLVQTCPVVTLNTQEIFWIKVCKDYCRLTNLTDGGDGNNGQFRSNESKKRTSDTLKRKIKAGLITYDVERCKKISESHKGKTISLETREKLRNVNLGKKQSLETVRLRTQNQGRKVSVAGIFYKSIREAAKASGLSENVIFKKCNKKAKRLKIECFYVV
jgi:hypothetical protein